MSLHYHFHSKGSDSGGSIRNPCHNCGIVGLKPTSGRLPLHGQASDGGLPGPKTAFFQFFTHKKYFHDIINHLIQFGIREFHRYFTSLNFKELQTMIV